VKEDEGREKGKTEGHNKKEKKKEEAQVCVCVCGLYTGSEREKRDDDEKRGEEKGITRAINQCPILMVPSSDPTI
jgi:hypothetical protein